MVINRIRAFEERGSDKRFEWQGRRTAGSLDLEQLFADSAIGIRPAPAAAPNQRRRPRGSETTPPKHRRPDRRGWRSVRPSVRRRNWVLAVSIGIALAIGALVGSGVFDDRARFNAERYAAGSGEVELYTVPGVYGHPGAQPRAAQARSGSIREFLGMSSAF